MTRRIVGAEFFVLALTALFFAALHCEVPAARARHHHRHQAVQKPPAPEEEYFRTAATALAAKDFAAARQAFSQAYRLRPSAGILYQLGLIAEQEGRILEAQDLMQRYLSDPNVEGNDSPEQAECQRILALKRPASSRLNIIGDRGTLVILDERVVGVLPLSRPLIITPAPHKLALENDGERVEEPVSVLPGRSAELRYNRASAAVLLAVLPTVILFDEVRGLPAKVQESIERTVERVLQDEHLSIVAALQALEAANDPMLARCLSSLRCQVRLGRISSAEFALRLGIAPVGRSADWQLDLELIDTGVADVAAQSKRSCKACTPALVDTLLAEALPALLIDAQSRPRGTLEVTTEPAGAELRVGNRVLGVSPYQGPAWTGPLELEINLKGYEHERRRVLIVDRQTETLRLSLNVEVKEPAPAPLIPEMIPGHLERAKRPRVRLAIGGVLLGVAVLSLGIGGALYSASDPCVGMPQAQLPICAQRQDNTRGGAALLGSGVALGIAGALLLAAPGSFHWVNPKPQQP